MEWIIMAHNGIISNQMQRSKRMVGCYFARNAVSYRYEYARRISELGWAKLVVEAIAEMDNNNANDVSPVASETNFIEWSFFSNMYYYETLSSWLHRKSTNLKHTFMEYLFRF